MVNMGPELNLGTGVAEEVSDASCLLSKWPGVLREVQVPTVVGPLHIAMCG